jgi:hypothetical protein
VPGGRTREVTLDPGDLCGHSGQKTRARRSLPGPDAGHPLQGNAGSVGLSGFFMTLLKLTVVNIADRDMIAPTVTISQCRVACAAAQGLSR